MNSCDDEPLVPRFENIMDICAYEAPNYALIIS